MGERDIGNLDQVPEGAERPVTPPAPEKVVRLEPAPTPPLVELNYPEPTLLSIVIRDVARWSRMAFVMEPSVNTRIQIFSPRKMPPSEAYDLFLASLAVVSLRAVQTGHVVKIVPITLSVSA